MIAQGKRPMHQEKELCTRKKNYAIGKRTRKKNYALGKRTMNYALGKRTMH